MKDICKNMGLFQCCNCFWGVSQPYCEIELYEASLSRNYIKDYISRSLVYNTTLSRASHDRHHTYFIAALKRNPNMCSIYEKLILLV